MSQTFFSGMDMFLIWIVIDRDRLVALNSGSPARDRTTRLVVHAYDQEFLAETLVIDPKGRNRPATDVGARLQSGHGTIELLCREGD